MFQKPRDLHKIIFEISEINIAPGDKIGTVLFESVEGNFYFVLPFLAKDEGLEFDWLEQQYHNNLGLKTKKEMQTIAESLNWKDSVRDALTLKNSKTFD